MKYQQVSGQTPVIHYNIPSELDGILGVPKQEAILTYLAQIPHTLFPEFIKDILVLVDHHSLISITDGPGDEKQDILTITPDGKRCLIQCKHTLDYLSKYNGNDLDMLHTICIRKNCQQGLFITNGEITTQAKIYVNDFEYLRGWPKGSEPIKIGYWNFITIWGKIHTNNTILNKWFGGLGQAHGLRNFTFEFALHQLPFQSIKNEGLLDKLLSNLVAYSIIKQCSDEFTYEGRIDDYLHFTIRPGIHLLNHIDIPYIPPEDNEFYSIKILESISIEIFIRHSNSFNPSLVRKEVVSYLLENSLMLPLTDNWWHMLCGRITSFVFLHDIQEPRQIILEKAETFIKTATSSIYSEIDFCRLSEEEYIYSTEEKDRGMFKHIDSGIYLIQYFVQQRYLFDGFNTNEIQEKQRQSLTNYTFKMSKQVHPDLISYFINRLLPNWLSFKNEESLIWCYPANEDLQSINIFEERLREKGLKIFTITANEKEKIIEDIDMIIPEYMMHDKLEHLSFPIDLKERLLWLTKSLVVSKTYKMRIILELIAYKYGYEKAWGYLHPRTTQKISYEDLTDKLFEVNKLRGPVMLDINIWNNPIWVVMRFREPPVLSSNELAREAIKAFEKIFTEIVSIFSKYEKE